MVPPVADQQLFHGDVPASLPGMGSSDAVLAVATVRDELPDVKRNSVVVTEHAVSDAPLGVGVRDAALVVQEGDVHHVPASDEAPRSVGSTILNETSFNSDAKAPDQVLIQRHSMTLTEQVLLHRDAQLLGLQVVLEPPPSVPSASGLNGVSRPGQLGEDFCSCSNLRNHQSSLSLWLQL